MQYSFALGIRLCLGLPVYLPLSSVCQSVRTSVNKTSAHVNTITCKFYVANCQQQRAKRLPNRGNFYSPQRQRQAETNAETETEAEPIELQIFVLSYAMRWCWAWLLRICYLCNHIHNTHTHTLMHVCMCWPTCMQILQPQRPSEIIKFNALGNTTGPPGRHRRCRCCLQHRKQHQYHRSWSSSTHVWPNTSPNWFDDADADDDDEFSLMLLVNTKRLLSFHVSVCVCVNI